MPLHAEQVDPRDVRWEQDQPTFCVYVWRQPRLEDLPHGDRAVGLSQADLMWTCSEWELTGGDVDHALSWANEHVKADDVAEVWVVVPDPKGGNWKGMVRLRGQNPTRFPRPA